jgi:hypothetical protein
MAVHSVGVQGRITLVVDVEGVAVGSLVAVLLTLVRVVGGQGVVSNVGTGRCGSLVRSERQIVSIRSASSDCGRLVAWCLVFEVRYVDSMTHVVDGVGEKRIGVVGSGLRTGARGLLGAGTITLLERRTGLCCRVCDSGSGRRVDGRGGSSRGRKTSGSDRVGEGIRVGGRCSTGGSSIDRGDVEAGSGSHDTHRGTSGTGLNDCINDIEIE